jgi:hypothetical protein
MTTKPVMSGSLGPIGNVPPFICRSERGPRAAAGRHRHMMLTMTASRERSGVRPIPAGTPRGPPLRQWGPRFNGTPVLTLTGAQKGGLP